MKSCIKQNDKNGHSDGTIACMRNLFLIGLSGSGKSTVGRLLAQRLGLPLLDTDALVEEEQGERIPTLFSRYGEAYFRLCESRALTHVIATYPQGAIIATGGGIVTQSENRVAMAEHGICIYLQIEPQFALQRLQAHHIVALAQGAVPEERPLLSGPHPLTTLQQLLLARSQWYEEAKYTCLVQDKSAERVTQEILAMLINSGELDGLAPIMRRVHIDKAYDTVVDWGGLGRLSDYLKKLRLPSRIFLVTDSNLSQLYAAQLLQQLTQAGFEPYIYTIQAGEASKAQAQLNAVYDWLLEHHAERQEALIAFGGGVVGDLTGFVAATYLRGVPLVQVPTSLLAQVDAAIGGKTGINHPRGKNLIGAFYHPRLVLADPSLLLTLPTRERTEGWAEVVKYGIILDAELFARLEEHAQMLRTFASPSAALLCQIVARCIELKVEVIEEDEREQARRAILNYGHTIGHAIENVAGYGQWLHGEAVSLGMVAAALLAHEAGMFPFLDMQRQNRLLAELGLPITYSGPIQAQEILSAIQLDKKIASKRVRWIMPLRIGEVQVTTMPDELVQRVISAFFAEKSV